MLNIISLIGLALYFVMLLVVVTLEKKNTTVDGFFFANRNLPFWMLSITFIASWWGAGSALATADKGFNEGIGAFWYYGVPVLIATFAMFLGAKAIRKVGYRTQGKMMEARYSKVVSKSLSAVIVLFMVLTAASQIVGLGLFFGTYLGLSYEFGILVGTVIVLIYSMLGGFKGVVFTDIIQFVFLSVSVIAVFIVALTNSSFEEVREISNNIGNTDYLSFSSGMSKYFMYVITFGCAWSIQANVWQRISATKSGEDARKMTMLSFVVFIPLYLIVVLTGMLGISLYSELPEGGIIPSLVVDYMHPVVGALTFVGITAAIMSSMDSLINTGAMTLTIDFFDNKSDKAKLAISKYSTLVVTAIALVIALGIRSILEISWIASDIITTGVFVPLVAAFIWKRGTSKAAVASIVWGVVFSLYNLLIKHVGLDLPRVWTQGSASQIIFGFACSLLIFVVISLLTTPQYEKADEFIKRSR